jgi:hypothetical protein
MSKTQKVNQGTFWQVVKRNKSECGLGGFASVCDVLERGVWNGVMRICIPLFGYVLGVAWEKGGERAHDCQVIYLSAQRVPRGIYSIQIT